MSDPIPITEPRQPVTRNPQTLTYYGTFKAGKTEAATRLPGQTLVIECQRGGGDHLAGWFMDIHQLVDAGKFGKAMADARAYDDAFFETLQQVGDAYVAGKPMADFVVVDRLDIVQDWVFTRALKEFRKSLIGRSEKFNDLQSVTDIPGVGSGQSPGWRWVRDEMHRTMWMMQRCAKHVVLIAHMRDKFGFSNTPKSAGDAMPNDIDLVGSLRKLVCADSSSFGFMYRNPNNDLLLTFKTSDTTVCGTYCRHLRGKEFVIGKVNAAGETVYDWSQIYVPELEPPAPAPAESAPK